MKKSGSFGPLHGEGGTVVSFMGHFVRQEDREARELWRQMIYAVFGYLPEAELNILKAVKAKELAHGLLTVEVNHTEVLEWLDRYYPLMNAYLSRWYCRLCVDFRPEQVGDTAGADMG